MYVYVKLKYIKAQASRAAANVQEQTNNVQFMPPKMDIAVTSLCAFIGVL